MRHVNELNKRDLEQKKQISSFLDKLEKKEKNEKIRDDKIKMLKEKVSKIREEKKMIEYDYFEIKKRKRKNRKRSC